MVPQPMDVGYPEFVYGLSIFRVSPRQNQKAPE